MLEILPASAPNLAPANLVAVEDLPTDAAIGIEGMAVARQHSLDVPHRSRAFNGSRARRYQQGQDENYCGDSARPEAI